MHKPLPTILAFMALAMVPTLALAGPGDTAIVTDGQTTVAAVPVTNLPTTCTGDFCTAPSAGGSVVNFSTEPATTSYPPSPCNPDAGSCTYINLTVPSH